MNILRRKLLNLMVITEAIRDCVDGNVIWNNLNRTSEIKVKIESAILKMRSVASVNLTLISLVRFKLFHDNIPVYAVPNGLGNHH